MSGSKEFDHIFKEGKPVTEPIGESTFSQDLSILWTTTTPIVIEFGDHPSEVSAHYYGRLVYRELLKQGVNVVLERMPVELTEIGSVVKELTPIDEGKTRIPWLRDMYSRYPEGSFFFQFHNHVYDQETDAEEGPLLEKYRLSGVDYPRIKDFESINGFAFGIPAIFKPSNNERLLGYGEEKGIEEANWHHDESIKLYRKGVMSLYPGLPDHEVDELAEESMEYLRQMAIQSGINLMNRDEMISSTKRYTARVVNFPASQKLVADDVIKRLLIHEMAQYIQAVKDSDS